MKKVKILDKEFEIFISNEEINSAIEKIAQQINIDLKDKNPLFLCILNGSFMFASDLFKQIEAEGSEISFVKLASYQGTSTTGKVKQLIGLNEEIKNRTIVILEDIVDSGITMTNIISQLNKLQPADIKIATLLFKPEALKADLELDYIGIEIPNDFIVGYGLDYDGLGRNLKNIYRVTE